MFLTQSYETEERKPMHSESGWLLPDWKKQCILARQHERKQMKHTWRGFRGRRNETTESKSTGSWSQAADLLILMGCCRAVRGMSIHVHEAVSVRHAR